MFNIIPIILLAICLPEFKCNTKSYNFSSYLHPSQTKAINGLFTYIVFISHFLQYITRGNSNEIVWIIHDYLGQLIVTPFFFYSGYAIYYKIQEKREYVNEIPKKRLLSTYSKFFVAVLLFLILSIVLQNKYSISDVLFSFIGLKSLGNSTWYIVTILCLWIITFFSFKVFKKDIISFICVFFLMILYSIIITRIKSAMWANTSICYFGGMIYCKYKKSIEEKITKFGFKLYLPLILSNVVLFVFLQRYNTNFIIHSIWGLVFCAIILLVSMKLSINNFVLRWGGENTFEIYMLQRIPMIVFQDVIKNEMLFFVICLIITILLAMIFKKIWSYIWAYCFDRKNNIKRKI